MRPGSQLKLVATMGAAALLVAAATAPVEATTGLSAAHAALPECAGVAATIVGTEGDDEILGTDGNDVIVGLEGADDIRAGLGGDLICGGPGSDLYLNGDAGQDRVYGGGDQPGSTIGDFIVGGTGNDVLWADAEGPGRPVSDSGGSDNLLGQEGDDHLVGGPTGDFLGGYEHDDRLNGRAGNDDLFGSEGDDHIAAGVGNDTITPDGDRDVGGDDVVEAGAGRDEVSYLERIEPLTVNIGAQVATGAGTDTLIGIEDAEGSFAADVLIGSDGPNVLSGVSGTDQLSGLGGDDLLRPDAHGLANDAVDGGPGTDEVDYSQTGPWDPDHNPLTVDLAAGTVSGAGDDTLLGIEDATGGEDPDTLLGDSGDNNLRGMSRGDTIVGRGGHDTGHGGRGVDNCQVEVATACEN